MKEVWTELACRGYSTTSEDKNVNELPLSVPCRAVPGACFPRVTPGRGDGRGGQTAEVAALVLGSLSRFCLRKVYSGQKKVQDSSK